MPRAKEKKQIDVVVKINHYTERKGKLTSVGPLFRLDGIIWRVYLCECGNHILVRPRCKESKAMRDTQWMCRQCIDASHDFTKSKKSEQKLAQPVPPTELDCPFWEHPLANTYYAMIHRCYYETDKYYHNYGGRGIKVCERWQPSYEGFANFLKDMGPKPTNLHTLDRINNDGNYEPGNCRWATRREQSMNQKNTVLHTINGESHVVAEWARRYSVSHIVVQRRLAKGEDLEHILKTAKKHVIKYLPEDLP